MTSVVYKTLPPHYIKPPAEPTDADYAPYLNAGHQKILFTCAKFLNDPLECRVLDFDAHWPEAYGPLYTAALKMNLGPILQDGFKREDIPFWRQTLQTKLGILSLVANRTSSAMWAHYALGHRGYTVGFKSDDSFFKGQKEPLQITPLRAVEYRRQPPRFSANNLADSMFTKGNEWAYEEEMRMVIDFTEVGNPNLLTYSSFRVDAHFAEDGQLQGVLVKVPHEAIESLTVGWLATKRFVSHLRKRALELDVPLLFAKPAESSFHMEIVTEDPNESRSD